MQQFAVIYKVFYYFWLVAYNSTMNERYRLLLDRDEVNQRIGELARRIVVDHFDDDPLFVGLLRGAAPFASKLMFEIARQPAGLHPELDYMMVSTYGSSHHAGEPRIVTDLSPTTVVYGRKVIIVDDVLDRGITAEYVTRHLQGLGAVSIELAVLAQKNVERAFPIEPTYCGFNAGDKWLVGMGMDDAQSGNEHYRWLEEVWEIKRDDTPPQLALLG